MLLEASDVEIFAVKVEVDFYFEMEEVHVTAADTKKYDIWKSTAYFSKCKKQFKTVQIHEKTS